MKAAICALATSVLAATTAALATTTTSAADVVLSEGNSSNLKGEDCVISSAAKEPRFDGLRFIETLCEAVYPVNVAAIATIVVRALAIYGTLNMKVMIMNCMAQDLSWKEPARLWEKTLLSPAVAGIKGEEITLLAKENVATT